MYLRAILDKSYTMSIRGIHILQVSMITVLVETTESTPTPYAFPCSFDGHNDVQNEPTNNSYVKLCIDKISDVQRKFYTEIKFLFCNVYIPFPSLPEMHVSKIWVLSKLT